MPWTSGISLRRSGATTLYSWSVRGLDASSTSAEAGERGSPRRETVPQAADPRDRDARGAIASYRTRTPWRGSGQRQQRATLGFGARAQDAAFGLVDRHVVDARFAPAHVSLGVELPLLIAVTAPPLSRYVAALVLKTH